MSFEIYLSTLVAFFLAPGSMGFRAENSPDDFITPLKSKGYGAGELYGEA
jgi:hypothetical protein